MRERIPFHQSIVRSIFRRNERILEGSGLTVNDWSRLMELFDLLNTTVIPKKHISEIIKCLEGFPQMYEGNHQVHLAKSLKEVLERLRTEAREISDAETGEFEPIKAEDES